MPELPEVETVRRSLLDKLIHRTVRDVTVLFSGCIYYPGPDEFARQLKDKQFVDLQRRGKYLLCRMSSELVMIVHLRMSGRLLYVCQSEAVDRHTRVIFHLDGGQDLRFVDTRKFGMLYLVKTGEETLHAKGLKNLGPEPLTDAFSPSVLDAKLQGRRAKIKSFLLDQRHIAGLGNIYADEALFRAGILPDREAGSLSEAEVSRLYEAIEAVLQAGIDFGGTSVRNYVNGEGRAGSFQDYLSVYGRQDEPCVGCHHPIRRIRISGRSSFFCEKCQI